MSRRSSTHGLRESEIIRNDEADIEAFYQIVEDINKGEYGKKTDDDLLGESADFNESLGILSNLEDMKQTIENLKK